MKQRAQHGYVHGCNPGTSNAYMSQHRTAEVKDMPHQTRYSYLMRGRLFAGF